MAGLSARGRAILVAVFVTFLWSTSWVLIKIGLAEIPALTFAGLRYTLAFLALLPFALRNPHRKTLSSLPRRRWLRLIGLGVVSYTVAQGTMFLALAYLPATTLSLLLNSITIVVALLGIVLLREVPTGLQWLGIGVFMAGAAAYFYSPDLAGSHLTGLIVAAICILANAASALLGRDINRAGDLDPLPVTAASMGAGSLPLLALGLVAQGMPALALSHWLIIAWLALVNSAFAFTLWNYSQRTLPAAESSIINNTMLIQIALLAWLFLGESLDGREIMGLGLATVGAILAQMRRAESPREPGAEGA